VRRSAVLALTLFCALAVVRVLASPTGLALGEGHVDGYGTIWHFWWVGAEHGWLRTTLLFHPWGKDIFAHNGDNVLDAVLAWPMRAVLGGTLAYNLWILVVLATNAAGGWALGGPAGAFVLVANPYVLHELQQGRPTQAWLALPALATALAWRMTRVREAIGLGVLVGLTGWQYWYYGLILGVALAGTAVVACLRRPRAVTLWSLAGVLCAGMVWPAVSAMRAGAGVPGLLALDGDGPLAPLALRTVEGDEQGLYLVQPLAGGAGALVDEGGLRWVPAVAPLLVACVAVLPFARGAPLAWILLGGLVALGPAVVVGDRVYAEPLGVWLTAHSELLRRWWWPGRAVFLVHLGLAAAVPALLQRRILAAIAGIAAAVQLALAGDFPLSAWDARVTSVLTCLRDGPPGAVIDLPYLTNQRNLWFQTVHGRPILGGMLVKKAAFGPPELRALRRDDAWLATLLAVGDMAWDRTSEALPPGREAVEALGYRWVLAQKGRFARPSPRAAGAWVSDWGRGRRHVVAMLGEPAGEDEALALWDLRGEAGCDY
jgi:hypothetical protein